MCFACLLVLEFLATALIFPHESTPKLHFSSYSPVILNVDLFGRRVFVITSLQIHWKIFLSRPLNNSLIRGCLRWEFESSEWWEHILPSHSLTRWVMWCFDSSIFFSSSWAFQVIPCSVTQQKKNIMLKNESLTETRIVREIPSHLSVGRTVVVVVFIINVVVKDVVWPTTTTSRIMQC